MLNDSTIEVSDKSPKICAYCGKPVKGRACYDKDKKCYIHLSDPTMGDFYITNIISNLDADSFTRIPFEIFEREVQHLLPEERPSCSTLYALLELQKRDVTLDVNVIVE